MLRLVGQSQRRD